MTTEQDMRKQAAQYGGGFTTAPVVERRELRAPEVIHLTSGNRLGNQSQVRFPVPQLAADAPAADLARGVWADTFRYRHSTAADHATPLWVSDHVETEVSDVEQPRLVDYGYWRVYVVRIWMPVEAYEAQFLAE